MKKIFLFALMVLTIGLAAHAQDLKKYENKAFSIEYPADWEVTWDGNSFMNLENPDEDDGTQTVEVWFLMISFEPQCFSGTIKSPLNRANEALDVLVKMLATLSPK